MSARQVGLLIAFIAAILQTWAQERESPPDPSPPGAPGAPSPDSKRRPALTFAQLDLDGDGGVTWDEFLKAHAIAEGRDPQKAATMPAKDLTRLRRIFREADKDKSSILTQKEWDEYPRK